MGKFQNYLDDYQGIHEPETIDPTMPLYICPKCKRMFQKLYEKCPECGNKVTMRKLGARAKAEDTKGAQATKASDYPSNRSDKVYDGQVYKIDY